MWDRTLHEQRQEHRLVSDRLGLTGIARVAVELCDWTDRLLGVSAELLDRRWHGAASIS